MKKLLLVIIFGLFLFTFAEAKENGSIEHIGHDIILTYDGETITLYDETLEESKKCPGGYHVGSAEDYSNIIKLWYNIKGSNYKHMILNNKNLHKLEETLSLFDCGISPHVGASKGYVGGDKDCIEDFEQDIFKLSNIEFLNDFKISLKKFEIINYISYKTSTKGPNNFPYVFAYEMSSNKRLYKRSAYLKTCTNVNSDYLCKNANLIRCFKNDKNTVIDNGFSKEYNDAYIFAYNNQITTMPTIEQANMTGEIIRAEIAKMLANWVKKFGYYADPNISCNFTDTASVKGDLATAIIESCKYGIMGQGITQFRPYDKITKAEVSTAVSRILRGPKYDGGTPFYVNHINALENAGILTDSSNINSNELRGNVMTTLMKANNILEYNSIDCTSSEYIVMCMSDEEKCPEKCKNN